MQHSKPAHEQLTLYRDQLANDLQRVEQNVSLHRMFDAVIDKASLVRSNHGTYTGTGGRQRRLCLVVFVSLCLSSAVSSCCVFMTCRYMTWSQPISMRSTLKQATSSKWVPSEGLCSTTNSVCVTDSFRSSPFCSLICLLPHCNAAAL